MQMKLKDLRAEFNNEKIQNNATLKAHMEQVNNLKAEIKGLQTEIQFLNEKHNNEKQSLTSQFKQLQQKYVQTAESLKAFESLPNVQQIQADNQLLQNEIISKNQQIAELKVFADESRKIDVNIFYYYVLFQFYILNDLLL
jgi:mRNA-degrading endonuclease HigB of HigAB toxin-antitoxin module